jgi:hypothetical protein
MKGKGRAGKEVGAYERAVKPPLGKELGRIGYQCRKKI